MRGATAGILAIGNELLLGDVLNSNTQWLCQRLASRGVSVTHAAIVRDVEAEIATELRHALTYRPHLVLTTGGLGPTDDDRTVGAIAGALALELRADPAAERAVAAFYRHLAERKLVESADMTAPRRKMARLPEGAVPLANTVGAAPGVWIRAGAVQIVLLPGVPEEMKAIFDGPLVSHLDDWFGAGANAAIERFARTPDESVLAPALAEVAARHPDVYVKSRAEVFGRSPTFRVTLSARAESAADAEGLVAAAEDDLATVLRGRGIGWDSHRG